MTFNVSPIAAMMNENSPICARPMPTRREFALSLPAMKVPKLQEITLPEHDDGRDDEDRAGVFHQQRRVDEQADGDEEDRAEKVAHGMRQRLDLRDLPRLGDDRADQKRAERDAVLELHREQRDAETKPDNGDEQHLVAPEFRHVIEQPRHGDEPDHQQHPEKRAELEQRITDRARGQRAGRREAREERDHDHREDVFHDENAEDEPRKRLLRFAELLQRLEDDRGRRDGENRAEKHAVHLLPAKAAPELVAGPDHEQNLEHGRDERRRADLLQLAQAELQPERKHEENDAQLRERLDGVLIRDERPRRVRTDDDAGQDVAEHDRLFEPAKQHRHDRGDDHDEREILEKGGVLHAEESIKPQSAKIK